MTVPLPEPLLPDDTVSHDAVLDAVHPQAPAVVTDTCAVPPSTATDCEEGDSAYEQLVPGCVIVTVSPATVNVPERDDVAVFALTV